uniref:Protein HGH1 N-terminal domain-containing protein n=1 Tax=Leersia perrieri TaxID=77586 RepID=A0A0D9XJN6_9ORYZ
MKADADGHRDLVLTALLRQLSSAADSLVSLSEDDALSARLVSHGAVAAAMQVMPKSGRKRPGLALSLVRLVANLTEVESGVVALLQVGDENLQGMYVRKLVHLFCRSSAQDIFDSVALILMNTSKVEAGRMILMEPKKGLLKKIVQQSDSVNQLRKKGVFGIICNCCFGADTKIHNLLSLPIWPILLLPVAGSKIYGEDDRAKMPPGLANALSNEREPVENSEIRQKALQAIYKIILQDEGQTAFFSINGPQILQAGYEEEENPKVMDAYELIGSLVTPELFRNLASRISSMVVTIEDTLTYEDYHVGSVIHKTEAVTFVLTKGKVVGQSGLIVHFATESKPAQCLASDGQLSILAIKEENKICDSLIWRDPEGIRCLNLSTILRKEL